jgi:hypothetical protein
VAPLALVSAPQAVFEVTTLRDVVDANDGVLSLREAIGLANDSRGLDTGMSRAVLKYARQASLAEQAMRRRPADQEWG